jgi:hypothetical protein
MVYVCRSTDLKADTATKVASDVAEKSGAPAGTVSLRAHYHKIALLYSCISTAVC